jgi:hypothetical protein
MLVLSTGEAAATGQTNPAPAAVAAGTDHMTTSNAPADWLAANGGMLPGWPGCPSPANVIHDPVMLTLSVRVPTNAHAFELQVTFFSAEFPEWVCSPYNDYFVALLESGYGDEPPNPADKNIAVYVTSSGARHPVGVNLAQGNLGLFTQCVNGTTGCTGGITSTVNTCGGTSQLVGTGFDLVSPGSCDANSLTGGATGWLRIAGNVVPGELITLRLALWDTGDGILTSTVLLDDLKWLPNTVRPGVQLD